MDTQRAISDVGGPLSLSVLLADFASRLWALGMGLQTCLAMMGALGTLLVGGAAISREVREWRVRNSLPK